MFESDDILGSTTCASVKYIKEMENILNILQAECRLELRD